MRCFVTAALVAAALATARHAHDSPARRRKTLGFGPSLPHSVFNTEMVHTASLNEEADPFNVARTFLDGLLAESLSGKNEYKIRDDSYTDVNTGVTHIYARQFVNGLEVVDGLINLNVKDGLVLSYGDSFYRGGVPKGIETHLPEHRDPQSEHCENLVRAPFRNLAEGEQVVFNTAEHPAMQNWLEDNCQKFNLENVQDHPYSPLLHFISSAVSKVDSVLISSQPEEYLKAMHHTNVFAPHGEDDHILIHNVVGSVNPVKAKVVYVQVPNKHGEVELFSAWKYEVEMEDNWYDATVTMNAPYRIISVTDWASDSPIPIPKPDEKAAGTYNVFPWAVNDPSEGKRKLQKEQFDSLASPVGWHSLPYENDPVFTGKAPKGEFWHNTTTTYGNNVFAHEDWEGMNRWLDNFRPEGGKDKVFDFEYSPKETDSTNALAEAKKYINNTITQLFYTSNMVHDLYYRYGFDEVSGNFQQYNFGRGGKENDGVIANAQDGSGFNNANFMTPPDGQNGRCRMYLWNTANPYRDGDLEAGIVIHELSHGLSIRLTGGPAQSSCLGWGESGGMGEGWGDFLATTIREVKEYKDYPMGAWAANRDKGIRNYVYSLDKDVNPSTYKTLDKPGYWGVHAIGEVWAEILWTVSHKLIEKHGFSDTLFPPTPLEDGTIPEGDFYRKAELTASGKKKPLVPKHGNTLIVQLVLNGMKLQPCHPDFFSARDAIIQADEILTGGENYCTLWEGFAERGLGPDARVDGRTPWGGGIRTNDFALPSRCSKY